MDKNKFNELLETESRQIQKLKEIVLLSIEEEKLISEKLMAFEEKNPPFTSKLADRVASFGGSWYFIIFFIVVMASWIVSNLYFIANPFDPYPFILLNLVLSTIAAIQAPVIMMSQNRKEEKDRQRAVHDYMVNLKAEIEVRNLHQKLDLLITEQMQHLFEIQKMQMEVLMDIREEILKTKNSKE